MRFFLVCLLCFLCFSAQAQSYEVIRGDTCNRQDFHGRRQGLWRCLDNNLNLLMECNYLNDKPVGNITYFKKNKKQLVIETRKNETRLLWYYYTGVKTKTGTLEKRGKKWVFTNERNRKLKKQDAELLADIIQIDAAFPGGYLELFDFVKKNLKYPPAALKSRKTGTVLLSFEIVENGDVVDVRVISAFDKECADAARKAVAEVPRWRAASVLGFPVRSKQVVPIRFNF
jgi:TonB family protein